MKTPMQEMLEWVNDYPTEVPTIHKSAVIAKAKELLEKERRAIVSAFAWGNITKVQYKSQHIAGEDYYNDRYNETFNTNQENLQDSTNGYTYYPQENKTVFNTKEK